MKKIIGKDLFYVGVNDRQKTLFENMWPLPYGVSYNSYLLLDQKTVLFDTVDISFSSLFLRNVEDVLGDRPLDYLVVNHMEPDHAGSIGLLRNKYPDVKIIGNKKTFEMLKGFHNLTEGLHLVCDGDELSTGTHSLRFYMTPMVHWPEVMMTYDATTETLFSADGFGTFGTLDGGVLDTQINTSHFPEEMERYYANIVGKYGNPVQKALQKLGGFPIKTICSLHGPVWTADGELEKTVSLYDRLSKYEGLNGCVIVYGSMYGNTEEMAELIANSLSEEGVKNIVMHNVSKSHPSYILKDIFHYKGLIIGGPTYCNQLYPEIDSLVSKIQVRDVKNRIFGFFGSFSWAGVSVKRLSDFGEKMKWDTIDMNVEQKYASNEASREACIALGKAMAKKILEE